MTRATPRLRLAIAALVAVSCASPSRARDAVSLRVVTWNVQNLFDEEDRLEPPGQADDVPSPAQVARKLERVGAVLAAIGADVVVLQEVENLPLLERLSRGPLSRLGYQAYLVDGADPRGIDVGLLARVPVERYRSHADERESPGVPLWSRDLVEAQLRVGGRRVVLLATHLVSQRDPSKAARRQRQARRTRELADAAAESAPEALVLVAGDLNDEPSGAALAPLLADGSWVDLGARLPPGAAWTWSGLGREVRLDYVLVPRRDAAAVSRVQVWDGDGVRRASDHRPVVVDLVLR